MRATVCVLLLVLASRACAQTEQTPNALVPNSQPHLPRLGETVSIQELRIPPKAFKELQRSQSSMLSGDIRSSAQHLERALQIYPQYLEGHNNLGARYVDLHEYEKAAAEFQRAIDIDPRVAQPFNNLSVALFLLRRYQDAETVARHALELDPRSLTPRYMLGAILATEKRNSGEALELLRQTESEFPDARLLLAEILVRRGALIEAEQELRGYLTLPGAEKRQSVERWLARLTHKTASNLPAQPVTP